MGQLKSAPLRALRTLYMERIGITYAEWRVTPWYVIMDAWAVWDAKARAEETKSKQRERRDTPRGPRGIG